MRRRRSLRPASAAMDDLAARLAPATVLGDVSRVWTDVVGEVVAAEATPTAERDGTLTVTCSSSVWAQELDLMGADIAGRLNDAIGRPAITRLRCQAAAPRGWARDDAPPPR